MRVNKANVADIFGCALKTVDAWVEAGAPYITRPGENGSREWLFDSVEVHQWLMGRESGSAMDVQGKEAKNRILVADAGLKEIQLERERGSIIGIEDSVEPFEEVLGVIKSQVNAVPGRLAQQMAVETDAANCLRLMSKEINKAWEEANKFLLERAEKVESVLGGAVK